MRPLNWFEKLINKYWDIRSAMCYHVLEENFSDQIEKGWEYCSGSLTCKKCGMIYPYYFNFKRQKVEEK